MKRALSLFVFLSFLGGFLSGQSITVNEPHGGASWNTGGTYLITWTKSGTMNANVRIRLWQDNRWIMDISNGTPNNGAYSWTVPDTLEAGSYFVRVRTADDAVYDDSPAFNIVALRRIAHPIERGTRLISFPALSISNVRVSPNPDGFVITFGYKNSGTGPLPKASEMPEKPDYRVLVDSKVLTQGRLFFPESPAPAGWEVDAFHGGQINWPTKPGLDITWCVGDKLTVKINENRINGMASDTRTIDLRQIALNYSYDIHVTNVTADWANKTVNVYVRIDGLIPQADEFMLINGAQNTRFEAAVKMNPGQRNYLVTQKVENMRWSTTCTFDIYAWVKRPGPVPADNHDIDQRNNEFLITLTYKPGTP